MVDSGSARKCQSCGHGMDEAGKLGTEQDGAPSDDYCRGCYRDGEFTLPDATIDDMVRISAATLVANDPSVSAEDALAQMEELLPTLKRWRESQRAPPRPHAE